MHKLHSLRIMEQQRPTEYCNLSKLNPSEEKVVLFIILCALILKAFLNIFFLAFKQTKVHKC